MDSTKGKSVDSAIRSSFKKNDQPS
jgi:hypothetical protein